MPLLICLRPQQATWEAALSFVVWAPASRVEEVVGEASYLWAQADSLAHLGGECPAPPLTPTDRRGGPAVLTGILTTSATLRAWNGVVH